MWDVTIDCDNSWDKDFISTHTSRVGCDLKPGKRLQGHILFLLTHPVWDVTPNTTGMGTQSSISTHTSRVGCDEDSPAPKGAKKQFLLTHPVWDVTKCGQISL